MENRLEDVIVGCLALEVWCPSSLVTMTLAPFLIASAINFSPSVALPGSAKKTEFFFTKRESIAMSSISIWLGSPLILKSLLTCERSCESFMNQLIELLCSGTRIDITSDWTADD